MKRLTQSDIERERDEARRKAQLDYNTGLKEAWLKGREEVRSVGMKIGIIHLCEQLLHRPQTPREQYRSLSAETLTAQADSLQAMVLLPR